MVHCPDPHGTGYSCSVDPPASTYVSLPEGFLGPLKSALLVDSHNAEKVMSSSSLIPQVENSAAHVYSVSQGSPVEITSMCCRLTS